MTNITTENSFQKADELAEVDIYEFLGALPTSETEFMTLAKADRRRLLEGRQYVRLPLRAGADGKMDDADFTSQVDRIWEAVKAAEACDERVRLRALARTSRISVI